MLQTAAPEEAKTIDIPTSGTFTHPGAGKVSLDVSFEQNMCQLFIVHLFKRKYLLSLFRT